MDACSARGKTTLHNAGGQFEVKLAVPDHIVCVWQCVHGIMDAIVYRIVDDRVRGRAASRGGSSRAESRQQFKAELSHTHHSRVQRLGEPRHQGSNGQHEPPRKRVDEAPTAHGGRGGQGRARQDRTGQGKCSAGRD